ncbi:MAG: ankyrin repeat domain-containing protein [Chlamydiia bacterium]|nr:ankyrin repeat domain-containing protein [Chlamydiia bacterium]
MSVTLNSATSHQPPLSDRKPLPPPPRSSQSSGDSSPPRDLSSHSDSPPRQFTATSSAADHPATNATNDAMLQMMHAQQQQIALLTQMLQQQQQGTSQTPLATSSTPSGAAPIPPAERVTFDGRDYRIPGLVRQLNGDEIEIRLNNNTTDRVNLRGLYTVQIPEDRGFWTYEIHRLMRNIHMPYDTIVAIMDQFLPNDKINLVDGHNEPLVRVASGARGPGYGKEVLGIRKNDGQMIKTAVGYLLERGADPNFPLQPLSADEWGYEPVTALHSAAYKGDTMMCEQLLRAGAKVDGIRKGWMTPLHFAAREGQLDAVKLLISWSANPDAINQEGETPLFLAADRQGEDIVRLLVFGFRAKMYTLQDGRVIESSCEQLIQADVVDSLSPRGCTPLRYISGRNYPEDIIAEIKRRGGTDKPKKTGSSNGLLGLIGGKVLGRK